MQLKQFALILAAGTPLLYVESAQERFGLQIGSFSTDPVMLVMNQRGMRLASGRPVHDGRAGHGRRRASRPLGERPDRRAACGRDSVWSRSR